MTSTSVPFQYLTIEKYFNNIYLITLRKDSENRLNTPFCQAIIRAFHTINRELGSNSEGAVITRGSSEKFWCTGVELEDEDPWSSSDGFYPVYIPTYFSDYLPISHPHVEYEEIEMGVLCGSFA
jgi:hypothetical protein